MPPQGGLLQGAMFLITAMRIGWCWPQVHDVHVWIEDAWPRCTLGRVHRRLGLRHHRLGLRHR